MTTAAPFDADRVTRCFDNLKDCGRGGLVTFITAGDPDLETSLTILRGLPAAGADLIELGMPFSDPMADGPAIQAASLRALRAGMTLKKTLSMVGRFRQGDDDTPLILMGYYNPIYSYGPVEFVSDARAAGVDGLIVVDLPPEEDAELRLPAREAGLHWIRLATPTTDETRLRTVLSGASGFLYYVSVLGVTGTRSPRLEQTGGAVARLRRHTNLPIAVGFGIRTPEQVAEVTASADAAVVGSALVDQINQQSDGQNDPGSAQLLDKLQKFVHALAQGTRVQPTG
ncbi:MAG: tryptophan synthase subunit alpha [Gammaproteobacteria bacterium]|nr:tryptophan synthase subunit alpha [Gammaproteobacteria bacterium]